MNIKINNLIPKLYKCPCCGKYFISFRTKPYFAVEEEIPVTCSEKCELALHFKGWLEKEFKGEEEKKKRFLSDLKTAQSLPKIEGNEELFNF